MCRLGVAVDALLNVVIGPLLGKIAALLIPADVLAVLRIAWPNALRIGFAGNIAIPKIKYVSLSGGFEYVGAFNDVYYAYAGLSFLAQGHAGLYAGAIYAANNSSEYEGLRLRISVGPWNLLPNSAKQAITSAILTAAAAASDTFLPHVLGPLMEVVGAGGPFAIIADEVTEWVSANNKVEHAKERV